MLAGIWRTLGTFMRRGATSPNHAVVPPAFDDNVLFSHLVGVVDATRHWQAGRNAEAWNVLGNHFRDRAEPLGFIASVRVRELLTDSEHRFPGWRDRLLLKVDEERRDGVAIYDHHSPPLTATFDWSAASDSAPSDRLYRARPHRLGFLSRWALACHYDDSLIRPLEELMAGWVASVASDDENIAYRSSHVVVYHFVAMLLAWPFIAALDDKGSRTTEPLTRLRCLIIRCLFVDCRSLRAASGNGVANNHLLAERFADWLIASILPEFGVGIGRATAEAVWLAELDRQIHGDGGCFEHSVHYQEHDCEMAIAYLLLSRSNGWRIPEWATERIESMLNFQLALAGPHHLPLGLGDTTEDPLLSLGVGEGWQTGLLREVQRAIFQPTAPPAPDADPSRETAFWLLDGALASTPSGPRMEPSFAAFPDSGFCIFVEPSVGARLIFRLGPNPEAPGIGGHSHGDILSLCLSIDDEMVMAPAGTYSYRFREHSEHPGNPNLRAHFASASSRSALFFEGQEPYGALSGDFRNWRLPCQVRTRHSTAEHAGLSWAEGCVVGEGAHVGHRRGVIHIWDKSWLVYDRLPLLRPGGPAHIGWQLAPGVSCADAEGGGLEMQGQADEARLSMVWDGVGSHDRERGGSEPFRGWVSPSYGQLESAKNIRFEVPGTSECTVFLLTPKATTDSTIDLLEGTQGALGVCIHESHGDTRLVLNIDAGSEEVAFDDVRFRGCLLVVRLAHDGGLEIRALGLRHMIAPNLGIELKSDTPVDFELHLRDGHENWPHGPCEGLEITVLESDGTPL
jgi:hypothetical protein